MSIEEKIIEKMEHGKIREYCLSCRDRVFIREIDDRRVMTYFLWSSPLVNVVTGEKPFIEFSFCNWSSQTTKERISHLLYHFADCIVFQKNWKMYLKKDNKVYPIDTCMNYTIENGVIMDRHGETLEEIEGFKY